MDCKFNFMISGKKYCKSFHILGDLYYVVTCTYRY